MEHDGECAVCAILLNEIMLTAKNEKNVQILRHIMKIKWTSFVGIANQARRKGQRPLFLPKLIQINLTF